MKKLQKDLLHNKDNDDGYLDYLTHTGPKCFQIV